MDWLHFRLHQPSLQCKPVGYHDAAFDWIVHKKNNFTRSFPVHHGVDGFVRCLSATHLVLDSLWNLLTSKAKKTKTNNKQKTPMFHSNHDQWDNFVVNKITELHILALAIFYSLKFPSSKNCFKESGDWGQSLGSSCFSFCFSFCLLCHPCQFTAAAAWQTSPSLG